MKASNGRGRLAGMNPPPPVLATRPVSGRRHAVTIKLLFIAALVLILVVPLQMVNALREERAANLAQGLAPAAATADLRERAVALPATAEFDAYRMVERAVKHGPLVLGLVLMAFFLFETLTELRLHAFHYGLVGAALVLFFLALLALGEVVQPEAAYLGAAVASSALITGYSAAILHSWLRAGLVAALLGAVHAVVFVVLRMEAYALVAGTAALFAALGAVMFCTRRVDWHAHETAAVPEAAR